MTEEQSMTWFFCLFKKNIIIEEQNTPFFLSFIPLVLTEDSYGDEVYLGTYDSETDGDGDDFETENNLVQNLRTKFPYDVPNQLSGKWLVCFHIILCVSIKNNILKNIYYFNIF
jgi:hypothetical protein